MTHGVVSVIHTFQISPETICLSAVKLGIGPSSLPLHSCNFTQRSFEGVKSNIMSLMITLVV